MRILFCKDEFAWPRASGHDVHAYQMMRAMADLGVRVGLVTATRPDRKALQGVDLERLVTFDEHKNGRAFDVGLKRFEERFRSYWGIPREHVEALGAFADDFHADAVVVVGLPVLPLLCGVRKPVRVWYAGDEWTRHHLSQVQVSDVRSWANIKEALIKGAYERTFRSRVDRAWAVSEPDAQSLRRIAGIATVDTLPNGVDADAYQPSDSREEPETAVFWGRLDFGPNIQALEWFADRVWPLVRKARPAAALTIAGFRPGSVVERLALQDGIRLEPNLPDIRPVVSRNALVVLPFVSGAGIKNKLLEAAAMAKAIVATPRSLLGMKGTPPIRLARTPQDWTKAIMSLWDDDAARRQLGRSARSWVSTEHTWTSVATTALSGIEQSLRDRGRQ